LAWHLVSNSLTNVSSFPLILYVSDPMNAIHIKNSDAMVASILRAVLRQFRKKSIFMNKSHWRRKSV
jgi:hypothetical protein